jgi:hypothetical protein
VTERIFFENTKLTKRQNIQKGSKRKSLVYFVILSVSFLEKDFFVHRHWINRLTRAEVDLTKGVIRFYTLRRSDWKKDRLIKKTKFNLLKILKNKKRNKK